MLAKINIFSLHFYLWFSSIAPIYQYLGVYSEHYANASSSQYGLLNMVLTFTSIGSKIYFCSLADRHQAYRWTFISFLVINMIGFSSYALMPFLVTPPPKEDGLKVSSWIMFCVICTTSTIPMSVVSCLSDTLALSSSKKRNSNFGRVRVWGTVGWAVSSILLSFINQSDKLPLLVPGLLMSSALVTLDVIATTLWPYKNDFKLDLPANPGLHEIGDLKSRTNSFSSDKPTVNISSIKFQWKLFRLVAKRRKSIFIYMVLFTLSGTLISLQWSYFFLYLKETYEADFAFISGFAMMIDSVLGELPFFLLSESIISFVGTTRTLSVSFLAIGVRYLLYDFLLPNSSMYFVILTELLQGPSFSLFYVVMVLIGNEYSVCEEAISDVLEEGLVPDTPENVEKLRQALRATMQSIVNSCYEGLGLGLGSIVGGVAIQCYGFSNLWFYSAMVSLLVGLVTSVLLAR